jgi:amino acid permease
VIPRSLLTFLVFSLPVLVVAFAVVMGGHALADGMGDPAGAVALRWAAIVCLMLLASDVLLLVGALGLGALGRRDSDDEQG